VDGAPGSADGGRAGLCEFDGDAGLGAPRDAGSRLARWLLGLGIAATLAANVAHGLGHGPVGAAVALVGCYELLMMVIRSSQAAAGGMPGSADTPDPLGEQGAEMFAGQLAADRVPSIRAIRAQLHVGQPRAQRLRDYLAEGAARRTESPAA
jgi:hypothetical protein